MFIKGEARSPQSVFAARIARGYEEAFAHARGEVTDHQGGKAELTFSHAPAYPPFELSRDSPVVQRAARALEMLGIEPTYLFSNGGLDANWLDKHGVPTITIGAGQAEIHTLNEYVNLSEYEKGCRLGILMATMGE